MRSWQRLSAELGVYDGRSGVERALRIGDRGQLFPIDFDRLQRVLGQRTRFGDDDRDRLALPARGVDRERILRRRAHAFDMREHADVRIDELRDVRAGQHGDHAVRFARGIDVDARDPRVRVRDCAAPPRAPCAAA